VGCLQKLANALMALLLLAALALGGVYYFALPQLDSKLADAVRREFLLPPSSTVIIERGSLLDTLQGQVHRFHVTSSEAKIADTTVEDLDFEAKGIRFDLTQLLVTGKAELKDVDYGELKGKVSEEALKQRWAAELSKRGLDKVDIKLDSDRVKLSGVAGLLGMDTKVAAEGELVADGSERVKFKTTELDLGKFNLEVKQLNLVFDSLTPVIDLGQFKVAVLIDKLRTDKGYLIIQARSRGLGERESESAAAREDEKARIAHEKEELQKQLDDLNRREKDVAAADAAAQARQTEADKNTPDKGEGDKGDGGQGDSGKPDSDGKAGGDGKQ
jgi:hypothetical protein